MAAPGGGGTPPAAPPAPDAAAATNTGSANAALGVAPASPAAAAEAGSGLAAKAGPNTAQPPPTNAQEPPRAGAAEPQAKPREANRELTPADIQRLFSAMGTATVSVAPDHEPKSKIEIMYVRTAVETLQDAGFLVKLGSSKDDPVTLKLAIAYDRPRPNVTVKLAAELEYLMKDGKRITVWKSAADVAQLSPALIKRDVVPNTLRENTSDFFQQLVRNYREAVAAQETP
jgi:hypothetical protein